MNLSITKDVLILGGGIAGLWLLNRLRNEGYDALLLEHQALGTGQTIASQGMIHGGIKYALSGTLTSAANAIASMPEHWKSCLKGEGDVDLSGTNILSEQYYMWPKNSIRSRLNAFLGSKALRGRVNAIDKANFPAFFQKTIEGPLYQLSDIVLDVPSLLDTLSRPYTEHIRKVDWQRSRLVANEQGGIQSLIIDGDDSIEIKAKRYITCSGAGTEKLLKDFSLAQTSPIEMQLRPLQMTMVKHRISDPLYVHCVADQISTTPEVTITSHLCKDGDWVWYLGGELAEAGASRTPEEQIKVAKNKIKELFPWCQLEQAQWQSFFINRAEAKQADGKRPENPSIIPFDNIIACWPSKLTLAPSLANELITLFQQESFLPGQHTRQSELSELPFPGIASTPWDEMFT